MLRKQILFSDNFPICEASCSLEDGFYLFLYLVFLYSPCKKEVNRGRCEKKFYLLLNLVFLNKIFHVLVCINWIIKSLGYYTAGHSGSPRLRYIFCFGV